MATDRLAQADEQLRQRAEAQDLEAKQKLQRGIAADKRFRLLENAWYKIGETLQPGDTFQLKPWISSICQFCATAKAVYADEPVEWAPNIRRVLKSIEAPDSDRNALRLIRAGFMGGEPAVESKLIELHESGSAGWASIFRSIGSDGTLRHILDPGTLEQWRAEDLARKAMLSDPTLAQSGVTPATDEKTVPEGSRNGHLDTAVGHLKKSPEKKRRLNGWHRDCINAYVNDVRSGHEGGLRPFVETWISENKTKLDREGADTGIDGFYKAISYNKSKGERWERLLKLDTKRTPRR